MKTYLLGIVCLILLAGCGSGSSVTLPQEKTVKVVFSASTSASLSTAVKGIKIIARIPTGVTVPLDQDKKTVLDGRLIKFKNGITFGSYSAPLLTIDVQNTTDSDLLNVREFVGIFLTYTESNSVTEQKLINSNSPFFPFFSATGNIPGNTVDLTGFLKPSMKVTF